MTDVAPNNFEDAAANFLGFLKREKVADQIEWIFPEDLRLAGGRFYVKLPIPGDNFVRARAKYAEGLRRDLGIELSVICWIGDSAYSNIFVPADERESELHLMPTGLPTRLKLSYPSKSGESSRRDERREAIPVYSNVKWFLMRRKGARTEEIKSQLFY